MMAATSASAPPRTTRAERWACPERARVSGGGGRAVPLREPGRNRGRDHRLRHEVALRVVAPQRDERVPRLAVLDAFRDHLHPERMPELDDQLHDRFAAAVARHAAHERAIDLHRSEERRVGKECRYRWSPYQ